LRAGVGVTNVTPVLGGVTDTGLPDDCCDAILLRIVYHEMREPDRMLASLGRALRPGGTVAVIENPGGGDHDIGAERVIAEFAAAGFELRRQVDEWSVERQDCLLFTIRR
jgi:ubiquinone/menaquinone biosynthesis C-methylase UbiE